MKASEQFSAHANPEDALSPTDRSTLDAIMRSMADQPLQTQSNLLGRYIEQSKNGAKKQRS